MVPNSGGGYSFEIDKWKRLDRFLILGSDDGTFYVKEKELTIENAKNVLDCIAEDGVMVAARAREVSIKGKAYKVNPVLFTMALVCAKGNERARNAAYFCIPEICRIGTHLFQFCHYVNSIKGWSRGLRNSVSRFYLEKSPDDLAYQIVKYRQRLGWTHRDVLRLAHPKAKDPAINMILHFAVKDEYNPEITPKIIQAYSYLKHEDDKKKAVEIIKANRLPRECIPTHFLKEKEVWEALLISMPLTALIRSLGPMTSYGVFPHDLDGNVQVACHKLTDESYLKKSRVHPIQILIALKTYSEGKGEKGKLTWTPNRKIMEALDQAFYKTFENVIPTGKRIMICLDVSGSMSWETSRLCGTSLTAAEGAAALCLVTARTEAHYMIVPFSDKWMPLQISDKMMLKDVINELEKIQMGNTDCAVPILEAIKNKMMVDAFIVYTDSETNCGPIHPVQALAQYRKKFNQNAKLIVVGMTSSGFSIADPYDQGMMDVVGFDPSVPAVISDFIRE